jgi:hypothetical protein
MNNKQYYFVVAIDLQTGTKRLDDETLTARFPSGAVWNEDTQQWEEDIQEEYEKALAILNNEKWENE